ncbi:hypothetical protein ACRRTK_024782 [Alexandromys fortis]
MHPLPSPRPAKFLRARGDEGQVPSLRTTRGLTRSSVGPDGEPLLGLPAHAEPGSRSSQPASQTPPLGRRRTAPPAGRRRLLPRGRSGGRGWRPRRGVDLAFA